MSRVFTILVRVILPALVACALMTAAARAQGVQPPTAAPPTGPAQSGPAATQQGPAQVNPAPPAATGVAPPVPATQSPAAPAPPPPSPAIDALLQPIQRLSAAIEAAEKAVERVKDRDEALAEQRLEVDQVYGQAGDAAEALRPRITATRSQLEKLGVEPAKGQAAEAAGVASERARLNATLATLDGAVRTSNLIQVRARQLTARIQDLRRDIFTRNLFGRGRSPLQPEAWRQLAAEIPGAAEQVGFIARDWWSRASGRLAELALVLCAAILVPLGLAALGRRILRNRLPPDPGTPPPTFFDKARAAGLAALLMALPSMAALLIGYGGLEAIDLLYLQARDVADSVLQAGLTFVGVCALARAILAPSRPAWRLVDLSDRSASTLLTASRGIAGVHALDIILNEAVRTLFLPIGVNVTLAFLASVAVAGLLVAIVRTPFEPIAAAEGTRSVSRYAPRWLKLPLLVVAAGIVITSVLGYVALGRYVASQVIVTSLVVIVVLLLHLAIQAIEDAPRNPERSVGRMLESRLGLDEGQRHQLARLLALLLNAALALVAIPLVLLAWGFSLPEILGWLNAAVFGFEIGQFRISLARILLAVLLFGAVLFATRVAQRWLSATVLTPTRMDPGLSHSIHTGVGYAGFALGALAALSYAGLDITNLAIVAGALSVGIGFGLQSIVNNFVSGLILLVERPIKVGDWIVVGGKEGYVRRISVRATEIETFDRASVIMPNSELITGAVTNWTHRNAIGRIVIRVGVSYASDPERVHDLLLDVAKANDQVLSTPAPFVVFENFGNDALEFSLRVFVADVNTSLRVQTALRFAISRSFREAGVEIPFPQRDLHLRDLDGVKVAFAALLEERRRARENGGATGGTAAQHPPAMPPKA